MDADGFVGVRLNFSTLGIRDPEDARKQILDLVPKLEALNWHLQINTELPMVAALASTIVVLPIPVVFDHIGNPSAELGAAQPGFFALMELVHSGTAYVKLSAPYNHSQRADWADVAPLAKSLIGARADRCLWGTNWPHPGGTRSGPVTQISPYQVIDNPRLVSAFMDWCPDPAMQKMILVDTPARLYRFPAA